MWCGSLDLYVPVALGELGVCCRRQDAALQVGDVSADVVRDAAKMPPVFITVNVESTFRVGRPDAVHGQVRQVRVNVEDVSFTLPSHILVPSPRWYTERMSLVAWAPAVGSLAQPLKPSRA